MNHTLITLIERERYHELLESFQNFTEKEGCGKCVLCREGTKILCPCFIELVSSVVWG